MNKKGKFHNSNSLLVRKLDRIKMNEMICRSLDYQYKKNSLVGAMSYFWNLEFKNLKFML